MYQAQTSCPKGSDGRTIFNGKLRGGAGVIRRCLCRHLVKAQKSLIPGLLSPSVYSIINHK